MPAHTFEELQQMSNPELERILRAGKSPALEEMLGWEFKGFNTPAWAKLAGIQRFKKGFFERGTRPFGYNIPIDQRAPAGEWRCKPSEDAPKRFGFYEVIPADSRYPHALLLDYGKGGNGLRPEALLRDYLVQVDPTDPELLLGKAYLQLGPWRVATNFFVLSRDRRAPEGGTPLT